jgi:P4 family phage/plasmid primase-like protien
MYWSKQDVPEKYDEVRMNSIDFYIDQTLETITLDTYSNGDKTPSGCGDFDIATVLFHYYKDEYKCSSVKNNTWYRFREPRWVEIDSGTTLRKAISTELRDLYHAKATRILQNASGTDLEDEKTKMMRGRASKVLEICQRLGRTNDKKNIMTEARELFFDDGFLQKIDMNPYLLCFNNGVVDFKEKTFRRGYPEDYLSKCTNIDYIPLNSQIHKSIIDQIVDFMHKLFPIESLHKYMWEHLASTLIGTCPNQTFNMYIGVGQNGKSVLVNLMEKVLGDYKAVVPLTLITNGRTKIGGVAPEVAALKGIRYAVMQEPSKGDKINEGIMKELTGGDPITARGLYAQNAITFRPQLKLVVCANEFMEIKSQDHGTWRRIRVVDFVSLFTEKPVKTDADKPYQYLLDKSIAEKFEDWKEVFASMLVDIAYATNGMVVDSPIVMSSSNSYRERQDYIAEFIRDKVLICTDNSMGNKISKTELNTEFTLWYQATYGRGGPSAKDVHAYMDKKFSKITKGGTGWMGCKIKYDNEIDVFGEDDEIDSPDMGDL